MQSTLLISTATFLTEQRNYPDTMKIIDSITTKNPDPNFNTYFIHRDTGLLMIKRKFSKPKDSSYTKIIVPHILKTKILNICYVPYMDNTNTYRKSLKKFCLSGILKDTKNFVLSYILCTKHKSYRILPASLQEKFVA